MGIIEFLIEAEALGVEDLTADGKDVWFFWIRQPLDKLPRNRSDLAIDRELLNAAFKRLRPKLLKQLRSPCQAGWENAPHPKSDKALAIGRIE